MLLFLFLIVQWQSFCGILPVVPVLLQNKGMTLPSMQVVLALLPRATKSQGL